MQETELELEPTADA